MYLCTVDSMALAALAALAALGFHISARMSGALAYAPCLATAVGWLVGARARVGWLVAWLANGDSRIALR